MIQKKGRPGGVGIVLLHGYGANGADLAPLADQLSWSDQESWYFPDAPMEIPLGPHMVGRAWFPIPLRELQDGVDFSAATPPGLEKASNHIRALLKTLPHDKFILGGFSQGAMLATHVVLSDPDLFKGLVLLSGTLVHAGVWKKMAAQAKPKSFFQSHGLNDEVLLHAGAEKLNSLLVESGWSGDLMSFRGGHEIPMSVLRGLKSYLRHQVETETP